MEAGPGVVSYLECRWAHSVLRAAQPDFISICCLYDFHLSLNLYRDAKHDFRSTHYYIKKKTFQIDLLLSLNVIKPLLILK